MAPPPQELAWKERASLSIRQLPVLQEQLQTLEEKLREKDDEILHLRSLPRGVSQRGVLTRRRVVRMVGVVAIVAVATALFLVREEVPPPL